MKVVEDRGSWGKGGIYHALLASFLLLMALQPFAEVAGGFLVRLGWASLLVACIVAVASRRRLLIFGLILAVPAVGLLFVPGRVPTVTGGFFAMATLAFICLVIVFRIFEHPVRPRP